jgi:hypothetical protein
MQKKIKDHIRNYIRNKFKTSIALVWGSFVWSCATPQGKPSTEPAKSVRPASSSQTTSAKSPLRQTSKKAAKVLSADAEYNLFFARMAIPENEYTERDRVTFGGFPSAPSGGTIHEAALVVGLLREVLTPVGGLTALQAKETNAASTATINSSNPNAVIATPEPQTDQRRVLESRAREKGLDIVSAMASNPYLKTEGIFAMAWDASRIEGNSQVFVQNLATVIKTETRLWLDLAKRMGIEPISTSQSVNDVATTKPGIETPSLPTPASESLAVPASEADNAEATKFMGKALEWAQKENYEKAILEARKVAEGTDQFLSAQESIRAWANKAVQELRRQAANQFRSGTSTNDAAAKKSYLTKAKNNLEEAINKFPEASTLDTVKENLDIITKELERIN